MPNYPRIASLLARSARAMALLTASVVAGASIIGDLATTPSWMQMAVRLLALGTVALIGAWGATVGMVTPHSRRAHPGTTRPGGRTVHAHPATN